MEADPSKPQVKRRVKVYQLDEQNAWQDRGTGNIFCAYLESLDAMCLVVKSEKEDKVLLESKIIQEDVYQQQQGTLIVWNDPETDQDMALSFQEAANCQEIWETIAQLQKQSAPELTSSSEEAFSSFVGAGDSTNELPAANLNNLDRILDYLAENSIGPFKKEQLVYQVVEKNYIPKLAELFTVCEDLEDEPTLHKMSTIFRGIIMLNDKSILDALFSEEVIMKLIGALEYDPDLPQRVNHREFLEKQAVFKEVVPFNNPELVKKIHQTFRIQYLKDVVLPRYPIASVLILDDPTFATLNSYIFVNKIEILNTIQNDERYLKEL